MNENAGNLRSLEDWIWKAACSIRGAKDAPKYKDYILPLIFTNRVCFFFYDELNRIAATHPGWMYYHKLSSLVYHA